MTIVKAAERELSQGGRVKMRRVWGCRCGVSTSVISESKEIIISMVAFFVIADS